ncbi:MAG: PilZ domain-containing protein [Myxococcota bacterium]
MPRSDPPQNERLAERIPVVWPVDCATEETFLFAALTNISALGIFVRTDEPLPVGTLVRLRFAPPSYISEPFAMRGRVQWVNRITMFGENLNPGMGIRFLDLQPEDRERLVAAIRTIAYLRRDPADLATN